MDKVKVLLASSHVGLCQSLQQVLEHQDWIDVVGTSSTMNDALESTKTLDPEVVILDYDMAGDSLETSRELLKVSPQVKIIVLSVYDFVGQVTVKPTKQEELATIDSVNWLSKQSSPGELLRTISAARKRHIH